MTLAEQIKSAVTAAIADLRAALVKPHATETTSSPSPAPASAGAAPATPAGVTDQVRAEINATVQAALEPLNARNAELETRNSELQTQNAEFKTRISELEKTIADPKGKIETVASTKAAEIAAGQGVPALAVKPDANPAAAPANPVAGLKGRARMEAAIAAQTASAQ